MEDLMSYITQTYKRYPLNFTKGDGAYLYTESGDQYIDFGSGISVVNLGHSYPQVTEAISRQASTLMHTSNLYHNTLQEQLAEQLVQNSFDSTVFFCNSGAEANEAAIKLARIIGNKKYDGKKNKIITLTNSFHGRTFTTLSATGQDKIKEGFTPTLDFFKHAPINDIEAIKTLNANGDTVAVMMELTQGEGGLTMVDQNFLTEVRAYCDQNDILLIFDEIQTGLGRTGTLFGFQQYNVIPDIMTIAKALGNGMPIGAMLAKPEYSDYLSFGTHGSTFGGNFLACAAGLAVMDTMTNTEFFIGVNEKSTYLRDKLTLIIQGIGELKGQGLMIGIEFSTISNADFIEQCQKAGLIVIPAGQNTTRIYPPLNVTYDVIDRALEIIETAVNTLKES